MPADPVIAILAGGRGTRLWPLSTLDRPKQFVRMFGGKSMLQLTFERAAGIVGADAVFVVGDARNTSLYSEQLPALGEDRFIAEPFGCGTAAAAALTAKECAKRVPGASVATIPSDHIIKDSVVWAEAIETALRYASESGQIVCMGAPAARGETRYGYIVLGDTIEKPGKVDLMQVAHFVEKPGAAELDRLIEQGNCARNLGTMAFRPQTLLDEMQRLVPEISRPILAASTQDELAGAYESLPNQSVDAAVLQHSEGLAAVVAEINVEDAGDFVGLGDAIGRDDNGNASTGRVVVVGSSDNTVFAEDVTVALVGVSNLVVVVEGDRILVCPSSETQRIKQISENS